MDIGWSELLLIGIVALIVVGPEDLPRMFRALGRITARARAMGRELSRAMEDAARTSGLDEAGKSLRDVKSMTSKKALGLDALDRAATSFEKWDPKRPTPRKTGATPDPAAPAAAASDPASPDLPAATKAPATPATAPAPAAATQAPAAPAAAAAPTTATGPVTPPVTEAPGRRQLRATRRSDRNPNEG